MNDKALTTIQPGTDFVVPQGEPEAPHEQHTKGRAVEDRRTIRLLDPIDAELAEAERYRLAPPRRRLTADDIDRIQGRNS